MTIVDQQKQYCRILIIEDSPIIMAVHKAMVEMLGYKPSCAYTGAQALVFFQNNEYDLVLSDIGLPDTDGMFLAGQFRVIENMRGNHKAHIVAITAFILEEVRKKYSLESVDGLLMKPLLKVTLSELIKQAPKQAAFAHAV